MRLVFRQCEGDTDRYELCRTGCVVPLEPKAFRALVYLVRWAGQAVANQDLIREFWPGAAGNLHGIRATQLP